MWVWQSRRAVAVAQKSATQAPEFIYAGLARVGHYRNHTGVLRQSREVTSVSTHLGEAAPHSLCKYHPVWEAA